MKTLLIYISILLAIFAIPGILASDFVMKIFNEEKYWEKEISKSEEMVEFYRKEVFLCVSELKKLKLNQRLEITKLVLEGLTGSEAASVYRENLIMAKDICIMYRDMLRETEEELQKARLRREKLY